MRNAVIEAMADHFRSFSEFSVLGPEYVMALEANSETFFDLTINKFPVILLDYKREQRERKGNQFARVYRGNIIVAVLNLDLELARKELAKFVSDDGYIFDKLYEIPTPSVEGFNLKLNIGESFMGSFNQLESEYFYLSEVIPCDIELWI